ncbi:hypothetical protein FGO68_gene12531 [Halteria grandinella]|uniref:Importin N-terminal domain-containing protein n=1 Tax=Halteria grandinella TaxID=5974 RepID=A0A8J8SXA6_HALGN|nr:hypothetical protein FGO68_gene12531 [Halteria grandinella]
MESGVQWQPDMAALTEISQLLEVGLSGITSHQQQVYSKLSAYSQHDHYARYLALIMSISQNGASSQVRQIAGLTLKAEVKKSFAMFTNETMEYLKERLLIAFYDPEYNVRKTVGSIMSIYLVRGGFYSWKGLIEFLTQNLGNPDTTVVENAAQALSIIVEDSQDLFEDEKFHKLIAALIQAVFKLLDPSQPDNVKSHAINIANMLLISRSEFVIENMESYMRHILDMYAQGTHSAGVRLKILQGLNTIGDLDINIVMKDENFAPIAMLMIKALNDKGEDFRIAQQACEFWSGLLCSMADDEEAKIAQLRMHLPSLLPLLMEGCLMTDYDRMDMIETKEEDLYDQRKPQGIVKEGEEQEEEEENYEVDLGGQQYSLRKSCGFAITKYTETYLNEVFAILQPYIENGISSGNAELMEPSVLVLGIISGVEGVQIPNLQGIVPFLMKLMANQYSVLRSTTLWTLSRFAEWIMQDGGDLGEQMLRIVCTSMTDSDATVQEAACTALCFFIQFGADKVMKHINYLLEAFKMVIDTYKGASLVSLLDVIGELSQSLKTQENSGEVFKELLPLLNKKWVSIDDNSSTLFPLFECFENVIGALGPAFAPYALIVFQRSCKILATYVDTVKADPDALYSNSNKMIRSIDLICAIFNAMGEQSQGLIVQSDLFQSINNLIQFRDNQVKQYVFGLLGDMTKCAGPLLAHHMNGYTQIAIECIIIQENFQSSITLCNNACWFIGQVAVSGLREMLLPHFEILSAKLAGLFSGAKLSKAIAHNAAITFGRLGLANAQYMAQFLGSTAKAWCITSRMLKAGDEKETAFRGFCMMIHNNAAAALNEFPYICSAFTSYNDPPQELFSIFTEIIHQIVLSIGDQWPQYCKQFPESMRTALLQKYGVQC